MYHFSLPGIRNIRIVRCDDLPANAMLQSICGCTVAIAAPSESIDFVGRPLLKWDGTKVNGDRQEKSTLEFSTLCKLPEGVRLAFVVTAADSRQYLVGAKEPCFPVVEYSETTGSTDGPAAVRAYKITHIAPKSVLRCVL